ncbi:MerR family transcriptional regulator [Paenibacillus filicis]|uniref:MerR family transcriptional regulator n=1 Tax=Paenibacillus gyeongsangnamensis TaxID=3388067 RepID=A0ABT4Q3G3_9BACL|nr:B12-binding domain-containing protein [Paenibacillus filicis]MCZ8511413.1 MerR family transcriptional regulator [Paenibacillus filicis]
MNQRLFTIKEVSMRTGLSTQLIRKWEERYEAVAPSRFPNGYRGYTGRDVETLLWLKNKVDEGVPIGLAVEEMKLLMPDKRAAAAEPPLRASLVQAPNELSEYREKLLQLFLRLDQAGAQRFFDQLLALHSMDYVLLEVLAPVLVEIGDRWERRDISEYQEHFGSHFVRERLLALKISYHRSADTPLIVTACSPGERHELGVLFFGYFALQEGFQIVYLGAAPSEKGIFDCLEQLEPAAFAFGISSERLLGEAKPFYEELDRRIAARRLSTKVFLGGRAIGEDRLMPGTQSIHWVSGDAHEAVKKMKRILG